MKTHFYQLKAHKAGFVFCGSAPCATKGPFITIVLFGCPTFETSRFCNCLSERLKIESVTLVLRQVHLGMRKTSTHKGVELVPLVPDTHVQGYILKAFLHCNTERPFRQKVKLLIVLPFRFQPQQRFLELFLQKSVLELEEQLSSFLAPVQCSVLVHQIMYRREASERRPMNSSFIVRNCNVPMDMKRANYVVQKYNGLCALRLRQIFKLSFGEFYWRKIGCVSRKEVKHGSK